LIGAKLIAGGEETGWVLTNDGIMKLSKNNVDLAVPKEDKWTEIKALATYGESVYLLDTGKSEIYKYRQDEQGEWKESRWLAPGIAPNFSKVIDMAVDGNVWLLDEDGTLRKFAKGAPNKLAANELGEPIEKACCVAVNGGVWVVDRGKDKVIEFDEDGKYKQQVVGGNLGLVTDVVVIDNKIWMLAGNKLYVLEDW
jgi:sugar lactone lactonase YvrE